MLNCAKLIDMQILSSQSAEIKGGYRHVLTGSSWDTLRRWLVVFGSEW